MLLSKNAKLIKKMSNEISRDPKASIMKKQIRFLYQIFKLEQLMDNAVYALVEEMNSQKIPAYQKKTEKESSTIQTKEEVEVIHNLTTNSILEKKLPTIPKEI